MKVPKFNEYNNNGGEYATNKIPKNLPKCIVDLFKKINLIHNNIKYTDVNSVCVLDVYTDRWYFDKLDLTSIVGCEYFIAMKLDDSVINKSGKIVLEFRYPHVIQHKNISTKR